MEQSREQFVIDQRNLLLLKNSKTGLFSTAACSVIFCYFFWHDIDHKWLMVWLGVNVSFAILRLVLMAKYKYVVGRPNPLFMPVCVYGIPFSGLLFSSIVLFYINELDLSVFYFFAICSLAMVNGATISYFIYFRVVLLYMLSLIIFPLIVIYMNDLPFLMQTTFYMFLYVVLSCNIIYKIKKKSIDRFGYMYDTDLAEKEKQISMSRLVAGMAHEINTPLGLSITYTSYMQDKVSVLGSKFRDKTMKKSDFETTIDVLTASHKESEKELGRVRDLVQTFKLVVPHYDDREIKPFCLKELLEKTADLIHYDQVEKLFDFSISGEVPEVISYPNAIKHVMSQLIENSVKHGFRDGVKDPKISIKLEKLKNNRVRLTYNDSGVGMSDKEIKYFFDPFYRGNVNLENKGLGGNIIFNTVTQILKGTIICGRQVNGCEFIIEFPLNISEYDSLSLLYEI